MSLAQEINRVVAPFEVISEYQPAGDQPQAIDLLTEGVRAGEAVGQAADRLGQRRPGRTRW